MRTAASLSSAPAPFHPARRIHHSSEPDREVENRTPARRHRNSPDDMNRQASGNTTPSPHRPSGRMAGRGNGERAVNRRGKRDAETQHRTIRPQVKNRPTRKMTGRKAIANERERESDMGMKQAGRSQQCPQPQIDSSQRLPRPGGGGTIQAGRATRASERGSGERKKISRIYIGAGGRYAFILFNRN